MPPTVAVLRIQTAARVCSMPDFQIDPAATDFVCCSRSPYKCTYTLTQAKKKKVLKKIIKYCVMCKPVKSYIS